MANPTNLKIDGVSFQQIRDNFKRYLQNQDQFRDYNFESSGISTLLDILSYNTYYNAFYTNMVATEGSLTTAQRRNSVVTLAASMNYTPRSRTSASIVGTLRVTPAGSPSSVSLPAWSRFEAVVDGTSYEFLTTEPYTFTSTASYQLSGIILRQGRYVTERYVVNANDPNQRFVLNNPNVDTSTLSVKVLNSSTNSTTRVFSKADNFVELTEESQVYFLEEIEDGKFRITFGDDIIGVALDNDNIVVMEYLVTNGIDGNGILELTFLSTTDAITAATFTAGDISFGGEEREGLERIRFAAPKFYAAQNRAVTVEDYTAILLNQPNIGSVAVWGGEDNDPPAYGKVFIAAKPLVGETLTETEKESITRNVLKTKKILTVQNEIIDPEFIYLFLVATVKFDPDQTIATEASVKQKILDTIKNYNDTDINQFSKYFRYSKLSRLIDTSERSILSSSLRVTMGKELQVQLGQPARYVINFSNAINDATRGRPSTHPYSSGIQFTSNAFTFQGLTNCFLEDNGGFIRVFRRIETEVIGISQNVGTIDYDKGQIILSNFQPDAIDEGGVTLKVSAVPRDVDVLPLRGQIISIRDEDITVNLINDKSISLVRR